HVLCRLCINFGNISRSLGKVFPNVTSLVSRVDSTHPRDVISLCGGLRHSPSPGALYSHSNGSSPEMKAVAAEYKKRSAADASPTSGKGTRNAEGQRRDWSERVRAGSRKTA